ncbi:MAG: VTT domain-containing protein [Candidatus Dojkabacteria bacterium]|nr:VTT domain-containing protein [Candidatus Dojkabacteria bacterium]
MFSRITDFVVENIKIHGYPFVFLGSLLEELVAPIPSAVVLLMTGAVVMFKYNNVDVNFFSELSILSLIASLGATLGALFWYFAAYLGGKWIVDRTSWLTGIRWSRIEEFQSKLNKNYHDEIYLFLIRVFPIVPSILIALTSGAIRYNFLKFLLIFFWGGTIRNAVYIFIGWYFKDNINVAIEFVKSIEDYFYLFGVLILILVLYLNKNKMVLLFKKIRKKILDK